MSFLPVLPLLNTVLYPQIVVPLSVGRHKSLAAIKAASDSGRELITVAQKDAEQDDPGIDDLHQIGTVSIISRIEKRDGGAQVIVQGSRRVRLLAVADETEFMAIEYEELPALSMENLA